MDIKLAVGIAICAILFVVYYIYNLRKKKGAFSKIAGKDAPPDCPSDNKTEIVEPIEAYVYNDVTGRCGFSTLPGEIVKEIIHNHGNLGRPRSREGKYYYHFNHSKDGYHPTIFPYSPDNSSTKLHRAINHPEDQGIWNVEPEKGFLHKYGIYLLFAFGVIFLMWTSVVS